MDTHSKSHQLNKGFVDDDDQVSLDQPQDPLNQTMEWQKLLSESQDPYFAIDAMFIVYESGGEKLDLLLKEARKHQKAKHAANKLDVSYGIDTSSTRIQQDYANNHQS